jgi:hypothetical protein
VENDQAPDALADAGRIALRVARPEPRAP